VLVNGEARKVGYRLQLGDDVEVTLRPPESPRAEPQDIPLDVVFEDGHLIVVNKQAGLVVHPAPGHPDGTLVNALLWHCEDLSGVGGELRPGIVHRLDKDTSGVMVASKDDETHAALADLFQRKALLRQYVAVVAPPPARDAGTFETLYGRHRTQRKKFSSRVERGKKAVTHYEVERRFGELAALVRCRLATGRTHQIRVHMADHGSPVVGDRMYSRGRGELAELIGRQALHAAVLGFTHPITGEELRFEAEPPADFRALVDALVLKEAG
jgi:23S rRNA pseudouridine1911/1915/1917 synthase